MARMQQQGGYHSDGSSVGARSRRARLTAEFEADLGVDHAARRRAVEAEARWVRIKTWIEAEARDLRAAGFQAATIIKAEEPKRLLLDEAEHWKPDCIFIGARGLGRLERLRLGSVSSAIAARAHCSVEVVRTLD